MKVLFCTNVFEHVSNGPARFANELLSLNKYDSGIEIRILTEDVSNTELYDGQVFYMPVSIFPELNFLSEFFRIGIYYRYAKKIFTAYPYDIIVFNRAFHGLLCTRLQVPVVGMVNDDNYVKGYRTGSLRKFIKKKLYRFLEKKAVSDLDQVIVNSNYLNNQLRRQYGTPSWKSAILYKGTHIPDKPGFKRKIEKPVKIFFLKADYARGGLHVLAQALRILSDYHFRLEVAGPAWTEERIIADIFKDLPHVTLHFSGPLSKEAANEHLQQNDMLCIPAYREALGLANIEALANGIPVVTTNVGGIPEVTGDGRYAWTASAGDSMELAEQLKRCIESPVDRAQKSRECYEWVQQHFTKTQMLYNFQEVLKHVIKH